MYTPTIPDLLQQGNGRSTSSNGASGRKAPKAPPGAPTNRLADPSMSTSADVIPKPGRNGNGKADLKALAPAIACKDGHEDLPGADERQAVDSPARHVQKWKVCDLKPYPLQGHFFTDESEEADLDLAANMQKNGQRDPIEILPDGTIIKGHRRTAAAKHNGWKTVDVVVRHDLVGNEKAIEEEFLEDNYMRRQLSRLQRARCAKRLMELAKAGKLTVHQEAALKGKTRDKIGRLLDMSGESVGRWLRILETPLEVQLAFDAKKLGVELAARVKGLDQEVQQKIAAKIKRRGIEHAKAIVTKHLPKRAETPKGPDKVCMKFMQAIHEVIEEGLMDNVDGIHWLSQEDLAPLRDADRLIRKLKTRVQERIQEEEEDLDT